MTDGWTNGKGMQAASPLHSAACPRQPARRGMDGPHHDHDWLCAARTWLSSALYTIAVSRPCCMGSMYGSSDLHSLKSSAHACEGRSGGATNTRGMQSGENHSHHTRTCAIIKACMHNAWMLTRWQAHCAGGIQGCTSHGPALTMASVRRLPSAVQCSTLKRLWALPCSPAP